MRLRSAKTVLYKPSLTSPKASETGLHYKHDRKKTPLFGASLESSIILLEASLKLLEVSINSEFESSTGPWCAFKDQGKHHNTQHNNRSATYRTATSSILIIVVYIEYRVFIVILSVIMRSAVAPQAKLTECKSHSEIGHVNETLDSPFSKHFALESIETLSCR